MRRSLTAVLALSLCSASALAADTLRIDIKGLDGDLAANARAWVEPLEKAGYTDTPAARMNVDKAVRLSLRALGYYQPAVSMTVKDKRSLEITVVPGEPVLISDVDVHVTGPGADERVFKFLQKRRVPKKGDVLNHAKYEEFKSSLTNAALQLGYFDAEFVKSQLGVSIPLREAVWSIDYETGERWRFGDVTFSGSQIDEELLRNMTPFKKGDYYNADVLGDFNQKLASVGWFKSAVVAPDFQAARDAGTTELPMNCDVTPRAANIFEVGLGYATDTGPRAKFGWKKPWINSRGHSLSSSTEVSSDEQLVDLSYKIPVVANPLEEYWLAQGAMKRDVVNDTDSNNMTLALSRNWEFSTGWQRSIGVHWMFDSFTQAGVSSNTMLVYPSISFSRTRSRGGMMPYWGDTQRYSIDTGTHYLGSDVDFIIMQAHGTLIRTSWRGHRFVVRGSAGKIKTNDFDEVPPDLRFFAGGDRSVRGYKYESISPRDSEGRLTGASCMVTGSIEYQYNLTGKWWTAVFFDVGEASNSFASFDWKRGAGVGIRWNSPVGPVKLDVAKPVAADAGEDDGLQFYIGLGAEL